MRRVEAKSLGLKHYTSDKPCANGHIGLRFVSNCGCVECLRQSNRQYQTENRDRLLIAKREWAKNNPEKNRAQSSAWQRENWEKASAIQAASKQKRADHYRNIGRVARAKRRAAELLRTPAWADMAEIKAIYAACPEGMEVDHAIPLQGKTVSGLHVPSNLQYLSKSENCSKGARHV
jgi:hypothetical protein